MLSVNSLLVIVGICHLACGLPQCDSIQHDSAAASGISAIQLRKLNTSVSSLVALPPLGFVKVHKTGGSTMLKIVQNLAAARGMKIMFPADDHKLGFPGTFPGEDNIELHGEPAHQYQVIANHAVFDPSKWRGYLREKPYFIGILRNPIKQAISTYNYCKGHGKDNFHIPGNTSSCRVRAEPSWDAHIARLERDCGNSSIEVAGWGYGVFCNPQAHDLGWYEYAGWTIDHDNNRTLVKSWIDSLDRDFGGFGNMMMTEYFDESLVMLIESLRIEPSEVAYVRQNKGFHFEDPTEQQLSRISKLHPVDAALYVHYSAMFWKHWKQMDLNDRHEKLSAMKQANANLKARCAAGHCPEVWRVVAERQWTAHLHQLSLRQEKHKHKS